MLSKGNSVLNRSKAFFAKQIEKAKKMDKRILHELNYTQKFRRMKMTSGYFKETNRFHFWNHIVTYDKKILYNDCEYV